jgi:segregation and condensation protein A
LQYPRVTPREPYLAALRPPLRLDLSPEDLIALAARALAPKLPPQVGLAHLHATTVSVQEQADIISQRLRHRGCTFAELIRDAPATAVVVARFLALLELFRAAQVSFSQPGPLAELHVEWTGNDTPAITITDEFDGESMTHDDRPRLGA